MRTAIAVVLAALAGAIVPGGGASAQPRDDEACFFQRAEFRGRSFCVRAGTRFPRLPDGWDDRISSISVGGKVTVDVCERPAFGGVCVTVDRSQPRFGPAGDNRISSVRVVRARGRQAASVCFYSEPRFRGRELCAGPGEVAERLPGDWNDRISSIRIRGDLTVEVCPSRGLRGRCRLFDADVPAIGTSLDDAVSSYRVEAGAPGPRRRAEQGRDRRDGNRQGGRDPGQADEPLPHRVCFYQGVSYKGRSLCLDSGEVLNRVPTEWRGTIRSIRIFGRAVAHVCEEPRLAGLCHTINKSDTSVGRLFNAWFVSVRIYHK